MRLQDCLALSCGPRRQRENHLRMNFRFQTTLLPVVSPAVESLGWMSYKLVGGSILGGSEETNNKGGCGTEAGRGLVFIK